MSTAMIMRQYSAPPRRVGTGDVATDAANAVLAPLTQQIDAKMTVVRDQVLLEVKKQGTEAKIYAVAGGLAAGMLGAYLYNRFLK